jgi:hypothetical protein
MTPSAVLPQLDTRASDGIFFCPEESNLYADCLRRLLLQSHGGPRELVEFGSGDGRPVIQALRASPFMGSIQGFELDEAACDLAQARIKAHRLHDRYTVTNASFYSHARADAECLIANPPYLPAPDRDIRLPLLYGGHDGSMVTNSLLSLGYQSALLMVSSYSNPVGTLRHAAARGYVVSNFIIAPLSFGIYSSEPKVKHRIETLRKMGMAFYEGNMYLLAGVLFTKRQGTPDLSRSISRVLSSL